MATDDDTGDVDYLDEPLCTACGGLVRMMPAGTPEQPYWECAQCGATRIA